MKNKGNLYAHLSLKHRLLLLISIMIVPLICLSIGILGMVRNYSKAYNQIMGNLKVANEYNIKFKEELEYSMYRVMIGLIDVDKFREGDIVEGTTAYAMVVRNPYHLIEEARTAFSEELLRTPGSDGDIKIKGILYCLDSLETAVSRMIDNSKKPGTYDENNMIWENDVQGLCSMIQDYITQYVYFETLNMEELQKTLEHNTDQAVMLGIIILAAIMTLGLYMMAMLTRSVTDPIQSLRETAERLGRGELETKAKMCSLEEINVLARTFNTMSTRIIALMEKTRKEQENLRVLELKLRQEQINPHFLYNTLDSIVWMAESGDNRQVVEMTSDLSDFFRTVLSEGKDFIRVKDEISHVRSYLKIQKIRYEEVLDYQIEIEPEIEERIILKMILQPIVENALYHGIKNKRGGGMITVRGYEDGGGIVFEVKDDGGGMKTDVLDRLRRQIAGSEIAAADLNQRGGFGLENVIQRIRMYYGEGSDITIESEDQLGTCVKIHLSSEHKKSKGFQKITQIAEKI